MDSEHLTMTEHDGVVQVAIDRPDRKNTLSLACISDLTRVAEEIADRTDLWAVILTGTTDFFSAGMDLSDPALAGFEDLSFDDKRALLARAPAMCRAWEALPQITITAIEGFCIGGGLSLAVSTDFRIMGDSSFVQAPEIGYGMNMSWGTLPRLVHLVGPARAKQIICFADRITANDCVSWGLAQWMAPDGQAVDMALRVAAKVREKPRWAVSMTKKTIDALVCAQDELATHMDVDQFLVTLMQPETQARIADFLNPCEDQES